MLRTSVGGVHLECCIYNASGPRTGTIEALEKIANSKSGAVLSKSATLKKQDGNPLPRFVYKVDLGDGYCQGSINSEGLPNAGYDYYIGTEAIGKLSQPVTGKPYIVSLSGLSLDDNLAMLSAIYAGGGGGGIAAIELNLACPNIPGKPVIAYDFEQMDAVLAAVTALPLFGTVPIGVKLAPYFDLPHIQRAASIIAKYPGIKYVVSVNTIGNGLFIDSVNECEAIAPKQGLGGLAGGFIKHTALANVRILHKALAEVGRADVDIVGVGGVMSGKDAFELLLCGAKAVQVGTCHWTEGSGCFLRIATELETLMKSKGYSNIEDFRGKLKSFIKPARGNTEAKDKETIKREIKDLVGDQDPHSATKRLGLFICGMMLTLLVYTVVLVVGLMVVGHQLEVVDVNKLKEKGIVTISYIQDVLKMNK